jgi:hypothetical protein
VRDEVDSQELRDAIAKASNDILNRDLQQVHVLAQAANRKYRDTRRGMLLLAGGFGCAAAAALVSLG